MLPLFPIKTSFDGHALKPLADSIAANGVIEPLIVRKNALKRFELVSGYRRLKAALTVGLRRVPCILINADELSAALISVSENINRSSPDYFSQAELIKNISVRFGADYETIAEKTGMASSELLNRVNLLSLKEPIREKLLRSGLDERYAMTVLLVPEEKQSEFIEKIVSGSLSPQKAKEIMRDYIFRPAAIKLHESTGPSPIRKTAACDVRLFSNSLSKLIKTLSDSGIQISSNTVEKDEFIEYTIKIPKTKQSIRSREAPSKHINPICSFVP